jgi:hypothetical protein
VRRSDSATKDKYTKIGNDQANMKLREFSPAAFQSAADLNDDSILRRRRPIQTARMIDQLTMGGDLSLNRK